MVLDGLGSNPNAGAPTRDWNIMIRKIISAVAVLMMMIALTVGFSGIPANAAGCGDVQHKSSSVATSDSNLLIAGRPVRFTLHVDQRDCDGYDLITEVWGTIHKDSGDCSTWVAQTSEYRLNPNVIGTANPPEQSAPCSRGVVDYFIPWNVYEKITSDMTENQRCIAMTSVVAVIGHADPDPFVTPSICVNGL